MTKEEYRKASHFRDATKMVAAPGSLSWLFDTRLCFGYASLRCSKHLSVADTAPDRQAVFLYLLNNHVK